jgi:hypothetical protein
MGLDQKTRKIEGHEWVVTQFAARPANKYKMRLARMIGPAITELLPAIGSFATLAKTAKGNSDGAELAIIAALPKVASALAKHVDEDVLVDTMVELMAQSTRDGQAMTPDLFDQEFAGNDLELYQALWFILSVNYPDFTVWVESRITGLRPKDSESQKTQKPKDETSKE